MNNINVMNILNTYSPTRQELLNKKYTFNPFPLKYITVSPLDTLPFHYTWLQLKLLNLLMSYERIFNEVRVRQSILAKHLGVSRQWINETLRRFKEDGIISSFYRHKRSCIYIISNYFRQPKIRHELRNLLPAIIWLPFVLPNLELTQLLKNIKGLYPITFVYHSSSLRNKNVTNYDGRNVMKNEKTSTMIDNQKKEIPKHVFSEAINNFKSGKLSLWGIIELSAFSDDAIRYADEQFGKTFNEQIKNPFKYLCSFAYTFSTQNKHEINWRKRNHLSSTYEMPENPEYFTELPKPQKKILKRDIETHKPSSTVKTIHKFVRDYNSLVEEYNKAHKVPLKEQPGHHLVELYVWCYKNNLLRQHDEHPHNDHFLLKQELGLIEKAFLQR